jgi:hypothetical protein
MGAVSIMGREAHLGGAYPVASGLGDIFSDLLRRQTEGTNLGSQSGRGANFSASRAEGAVIRAVSHDPQVTTPKLLRRLEILTSPSPH